MWSKRKNKEPDFYEKEYEPRKKKKGKKKYTIEYMRHPNPNIECLIHNGWDWKVYAKYRTEKSRDTAYENAVKKAKNSDWNYYKQMRFRKGEI